MACPGCNQTPCACPPSALDILASAMIAPNILALFSDTGSLCAIQRRGAARLAEVIELHSNPFDRDRPPEVARAGWFLAQVAVAILNACDRLCYLRFKKSIPTWHYGVVVVTTLVLHRGRRVLIVALNGGSSACRAIYEEYCREASFRVIVGVHEVHVVHNAEAPHKSLVKLVHENLVDQPESVFERWLKDACAEQGQDWHGEQKILRYVEDRFGFDTNKLILCLGISHLGGPCVDTTNRTRHCTMFLHALRERDAAFLGPGALALMGFWLGGGPTDRKRDPIFKVSFDDFK